MREFVELIKEFPEVFIAISLFVFWVIVAIKEK